MTEVLRFYTFPLNKPSRDYFILHTVITSETVVIKIRPNRARARCEHVEQRDCDHHSIGSGNNTAFFRMR